MPKRDRQLIDGVWHTKPKRGPARPLTRNSGTMTESEFFSMFKSMLRSGTKFWKPKLEYLESKSRPYTGPNKRIKKEYCCEKCNNWNVRAKVQVDHINPCGGIKYFEDIGDVAERMYIEADSGWQVLCLECHVYKTKNENKKPSNMSGDLSLEGVIEAAEYSLMLLAHVKSYYMTMLQDRSSLGQNTEYAKLLAKAASKNFDEWGGLIRHLNGKK